MDVQMIYKNSKDAQEGLIRKLFKDAQEKVNSLETFWKGALKLLIAGWCTGAGSRNFNYSYISSDNVDRGLCSFCSSGAMSVLCHLVDPDPYTSPRIAANTWADDLADLFSVYFERNEILHSPDSENDDMPDMPLTNTVDFNDNHSFKEVIGLWLAVGEAQGWRLTADDLPAEMLEYARRNEFIPN